MPATAEMTGLRKTAILLVGMGREASAKVLAQMKESEVEEITAEIMRLRDVEAEDSQAVMGEFRELVQAKGMVMQGGLDFAREMLEASMGAERAGEMMGRLSAAFMEMPFQFLQKTDPRQLLSFVQEEHPQIIALVLAHMSADKATAVLSGLAPELQADVAHRIAVMDRTTPEIIKAVEVQLERKLSLVLQSTETSTVGGLQPLVDILNRADRATERLILEGLEAKDETLAEEVRSRMFMFEDIVGLDDKTIQLVLRSVETNDLATALKGVSDAVRQKIMRNLSERAAENLADEIEMMGPVRLRTVEESQVKVVQAIRALEESGQIVMRRGGDDEFVS